jgi:hypothetical protein
VSFGGKRQGLLGSLKGNRRVCVTCGKGRGELVPYGKSSLGLFQHLRCQTTTSVGARGEAECLTAGENKNIRERGPNGS